MKMLIKVDFGNLQSPILDENNIPDLALYDYIYGEMEIGTMLNGTGCYVVSTPFGDVRIPCSDVRMELRPLPEFISLIEQKIYNGVVWVI